MSFGVQGRSTTLGLNSNAKLRWTPSLASHGVARNGGGLPSEARSGFKAGPPTLGLNSNAKLRWTPSFASHGVARKGDGLPSEARSGFTGRSTFAWSEF